MKPLVVFLALFLLGGCATLPPSNPNNLCSIFSEKEDWFDAASQAARRWGAPLPILMAIIHQESRFVEDAQPSRVRFLGIPLWRPSSAYGYGQAKDETWDWYQTRTGNSGADRDEFGDAVDFVAWYMHQSFLKLKIPKTDAYNHYLAYHEGQAGYARGAWRNKPWLRGVARKVAAQSERYAEQMRTCQAGAMRSAGS